METRVVCLTVRLLTEEFLHVRVKQIFARLFLQKVDSPIFFIFFFIFFSSYISKGFNLCVFSAR